jgi:hypothetical protein
MYRWFYCIPTPAVFEMGEDQLHIHLEKPMSDLLLPFIKTKLTLVSPRKLRSPCQELQGVHPSSRRIMLSSKSVIVGPAVDPIEKHLAALLGRKRILAQDLRLLVEHVCHMANFLFDGPRAFPRSTPSRNSQILALLSIVRNDLGYNWIHRDIGKIFNVEKGTVHRIRSHAIRDIEHDIGHPPI